MDAKVAELSVDELRALIVETVNEAMMDFFEDSEALRSTAFVQSIERAREEYAAGDLLNFEQVFGRP